MILDDFAYFKHNSTYDEFSTNATLGIDPNTICFVEDTGIIYTHGHQFGGKIEYQGINGVTIDGNTIALDIDYIEDLMPLQNVYTAGDYINISNNKISVKYNDLKDALGISTEGETFTLKPAEANVLGGIKIGYEDGIASNTPGRCYRVQLDGNNRAYVNVPWTDTKPTTSGDPVPGATEEYVNEKVSEAELRLQDLIEEAAGNGHDEGWWQEMFERYGNQETPEGFDIDKVNNAIVAWAQTESGKNLIVLAFDAREATWKNFVGQKVEELFAGSQIKQSVDKISLLVGMFDNNGDPNEGDWADFILGLRKNEDGTVTRFADLIADEINIAGTIITPELIASKINAENITITSKLTATNVDVTGNIHAKLVYSDNIYVHGGETIDLGLYNITENDISHRYIMEHGSHINLPDAIKYDGLEIKLYNPSYRRGITPSFDESPYVTNNIQINSDGIQETKYMHYITDQVDFDQGQVSTYRESAEKLYIKPGTEVCLLSIYGSWFVTNGAVSTESYN